MNKSNLFRYASLAFPLAFAGMPLYIHAPDFYAAELGLGIGTIGMILLFVRLFDAVQDPLIGYLSDRFAPQRHRIVTGGVAMLAAGFAMLFYAVPVGVNLAVWFAVSMILATGGFSIIGINLAMIGGFWQAEQKARNVISAWREALGLMGLLVAAVLPELLQRFTTAEYAYRFMVLVFLALAGIAFILFRQFMRKCFGGLIGRRRGQSDARLSFLRLLTGPDCLFFAVSFLTHLAAALPAVLVLFFIRDYLALEHLSGVFLLIYFVSGAALLPVWVKLAAYFGSYRAWLAAMLLAIATFYWAYFLPPGGNMWQYALVCALSGLALGADLALPPAIIASRITARQDEQTATQYYAVLTFLPKVALAVAGGVSFLLLDHLQFKAAGENTEAALGGLLALYALAPCIIKGFSASLLWLMIRKEELHHDKRDETKTRERRFTDGTARIS